MSARVNRVAAPAAMLAAVLAMVVAAAVHPQAQGRGGRGRGGGGPVAPPGRTAAPVDLTGTWV